MFVIENYSTAVLFCVITMICWGSWANTQKLAAKSWRFELFYWDYVLGILLMSLVFALSLGSIGSLGRPFFPDLQQAEFSSLRSAFIGGVIFNAANILLCAAIAIAGMSVAFPVGIGLALVIGVLVNYSEHPVGNGSLIFGGVALVTLAILINAYAYRATSKDANNISAKGLVLSIVAGILMGYFYKYVANSMFTNFSIPETGKLSPYSAVFVFAVGILISNFLFNSILMRIPISGLPLNYKEYFNGPFKDHLTGIVGGMIWCIGMSFSIIASDKAGTAISYGLGQGATVVAAIWGIFIWKEFKNASANIKTFLNLMLLCYLVGLALIIWSR